MTRIKGISPISTNVEVKVAAPWDARNKALTAASLTQESTWINEDGNLYIYNGMVVAVAEDPDVSLRGVYMLENKANYTQSSAWVKIGDLIILDNGNNLFSGAKKIKFSGATIELIDGVYVVSGFEGPAGVSGIDYLGDYDPLQEYLKRDTIRINNTENPLFGNSYYCKVDGPISGIEPGITAGWENSWSLFVLKGAPGAPGYTPIKGVDYDDGVDGREIQLQKSPTAIQWKYVGDPTWVDLVLLSDLVVSVEAPLLTSDIPVYGTSFGKYPSGSTIPAVGKTLEEVIRDAAFQASNPTSSLSISSGAIPYNSTNATIVLNFSNHPNPTTGGPTIVSETLRFKRGSGSWSVIYEDTVALINTSGNFSHVNNGLTDKVSTFYYEYTVVDSNGNSSTSTASVTPQAYVAPTTTATSDSVEIGLLTLASTTKNIVKQSVNTTLNNWQLLVELNASSNKNTVGPVIQASVTTTATIAMANDGSITINGTTILITTANGYPVNMKDATSIKLWLRVSDSVQTTDLLAFTRTLEYKKFYGSLNVDVTNYRTELTMVSNSATTHEWMASGKKHYVAVPSSKSLSAAIVVLTGENLLPNFQAGLQTVYIPDAGGNNREYKVYKFTTGVSFDVTIRATTN